jgi:heme iron utilization protein
MVKNSFSGPAMRHILMSAKTCTLSTISHRDGAPFGALANIATDETGRPILLMSTLAWHTQNLIADARASVMVAELPDAGDALTGPRVTVLGRFERSEDEAMQARYLAHHPYAELYAGFGDFSFWLMTPSIVHGVAGFGRIETLTAEEVFGSVKS